MKKIRIRIIDATSLFRTLLSSTLVILSCQTFGAQFTEIPLWPDGAPGSEEIKVKEEVVYRTTGIVDRAIYNVTQPTLRIYLPPKNKATGTAIIICPGGGFRYLAIDKGGYEIAEWLNTLGVAGFVLKYRTIPPFEQPIPLQDAQRAIRMVRSRAEEWNLDPHKIIIMGSSAGAMLAADAATEFDNGISEAEDPIDRISSKPDYLVLQYGAHNVDKVTSNTPPTFIILTDEESYHWAEESINFYLALKKAKVPAEMHIYAKGEHGFGIRPNVIQHGQTWDLPVSTWHHRWADWMRDNKLLEIEK